MRPNLRNEILELQALAANLKRERPTEKNALLLSLTTIIKHVEARVYELEMAGAPRRTPPSEPLEQPFLETAAKRLADAHIAFGGGKLPHHEHAKHFDLIPHEHRDAVRARADWLSHHAEQLA